MVTLVPPPAAFTASLSWTSAGSVVTSYEVMWQRHTTLKCPDVGHEDSATVTGVSTSYIITDLYAVSTYTITVRATNDAGTAVSDELLITTTEAGKEPMACQSVLLFLLCDLYK